MWMTGFRIGVVDRGRRERLPRAQGVMNMFTILITMVNVYVTGAYVCQNLIIYTLHMHNLFSVIATSKLLKAYYHH